MEYKDFDSFKINEASLMTSKSFDDFEIEHGKCEEPVFSFFPKYKFVMVTIKNSCYVYSKDGSRKKYDSVDDLIKEDGDISDYLITDTDNGKFILEQYIEKTNGMPITDIYQIPLGEKEISIKDKKKKESPYKKYKKKEWGGGDIYGGDEEIDDDW